jgi:hypothetical protein
MQKFDTPSPVSVSLDIPAGQIRLIATDRTDTTVEIHPANPSKARDVKAAEKTQIEYRDGVMHIATPDPNRVPGSTGSLNVTIELPTGSQINGKAGAAELHTTGRLGEITFHGGYRTVELEESASAHVTMHTGTVTVTRLTGPAQITNNNGDITITEATAGTLELRTDSGDITVGTAPAISATLDAATPNGRIHNTLKNTDGTNTALNIKATTSNGNITATSR